MNNNLKFCPKCGTKSLVYDGEKKWYCPDCQFVLYHNCAAAVAVVIQHKDEILFTRRNQEPAKGKLDLAGGFTDPKESAEQTCVRELKEELNIELDENQLKFLMSLPNVYNYKGIDYNTLDLIFLYEVEDKFEVNLEISEISEIVWIKKENIRLDEIAFESQRIFLEKWMQKIN